MYTIDLAFVERGVHEELVAYVADQEGYYEDEGVHVAIRKRGQLGPGASAPRRVDWSGPGPIAASDRWHRLEGAQRQHPSSAVLVSRQRRGDIHGRSAG